MVKVKIVFYSMYGHIWKMAQAAAEGVKEVPGAQAELYQVQELIPDAALEKAGAASARAKFAHIPLVTPEILLDADAILFGTPTRFGNMAAQMRNFLDQTGGVWFKGGLVGKVGGVFVSSATQHGGQETTITSFHTTLLHHGMLIAGVPFSEPRIGETKEMSGGTPYGASTIAGGDGSRQPSENELAIARFQGKNTAQIALALKKGRE